MSPAEPLPPRDTRGPTPVAQCGPVADLAARARELDQRSRRIVPLLPAPLREHVRYAGLHNDRILLLVDSPAWCTRVRMDQARILASIHGLGFAAATVLARVAPTPARPADPAAPRRPQPDTARHIRNAALAVADPELHARFLELAALAERPTAR